MLKARQVGSSSELAAQFVHMALFEPGSSVAVAAQTEKGAKGMSALYGYVVKHLPAVLRCGLFDVVVGIERIHWPRLGSEIVFGTANSDSFRGVPRQGAHITEAAFLENLTKTMEVLLPTVYGPTVLESTANGPGDFHILWNDPHVEHVFIGWMDDSTCVSDAPIPADLTALELAYIKRNRPTERQISWFVQELRKSNWESFQQEHPSVASEAFRLGGDRFFQTGFYPGAKPPADVPFFMHSRPIVGHKYAIGADPASGSQSGDRSAFVVLDVTDAFNIKTAASFAGRLAPREFGHQLAKISKLYLGAVVCVERNAGWGLSVLETLRTDGGVRLYRAKVYDEIKKYHVDQFGWNTSAVTRPLMLGHIQEAVDKRLWTVGDPRIEEECNGFRYDEEGVPRAVSGCHDDLVMAAALALQAASQAKSTAIVPTPPKMPDDPNIHEIAQWEMATGELYSEDDGGLDI